MASASEISCFFELHEPKISCSSTFTSFNDLFSRSAVTPLDCRSDLEHLLLLAGQFDLIPQNMKECSVCSTHLSGLQAPRRKNRCDLCKDIFFKDKYSIASLQRVTKSLAVVIWTTKKLAKYNCWACATCRDAISKEIIERGNDIDCFFDWLYDDTIVFTPSSTHWSSPSVSECWPSQSSLDRAQQLQQQRNFTEFLRYSGFTDRCETTMNYRSLGRHSQTNFINQMKKVLQFIVQQQLAPNDTDMVWKEFIESEMSRQETTRLGDYLPVMHALVDAYSNATHWSTKRQILSIVAADLPLSLLKTHFVDLTEWKLRAARRQAYFQGRGTLPEPTKAPVERYSHDQISHFIDFIISPHITIDLPFGERKIRLSTGETLLVPDVVRNHIPSRIIAQYQAFCKEQADDNFKPLSSTSLFAILRHCAASTRKSLSGLDYFSADGSTAFDELRELCEELATFGVKSDEIVEVKKILHDSRNYIKLDYKSHVSTSSTVGDHCSTFSLSDKHNPEWRQECDHVHREECESCLLLRKTITRLHLIITENKSIPNDLRHRFMFRLKHSETLIVEWKKHQIRSVHQAGALNQVLNELDDKSVLLITDWAMKFLPQRYREAQREFFGKRGLPWHLTYVIHRKSYSNSFSAASSSSFASSSSPKNEPFEHQTFCHIFDNCTQNCRSVVSVIADVLKRLKSFHPELTTAYLRSDNAACYHGTTTLLAVEELLKETGIFINRVDFSDPQSGKCACDRMAAVTKANVRRYINERHDCCNATQFVEAAKATKFMSIFHSRLTNNLDEKNKSVWEGVKSYNNLKYEIIQTSMGQPRANALTDVQVTVWRAFNIGPGKKFLLSKLNAPKNSISALQIGAEHVNVQWKEDTIENNDNEPNDESTDSATTLNTDEDIMEIDNGSPSDFVTFDCPDFRCIRQFRRESNLCNHLIYENHKYMPSTQCLLDKAGVIYKQRVESDQRINAPTITNFIVIPSSTTSPLDPLLEGWAIFRSKANKAFTPRQRAYLTDKYNEGEQTGGKWDPAAVAHEMQTMKESGRFLFEPEEFLTNSQIKSYFSRLTRQRRDKSTHSQSTLSNHESTLKAINNNEVDDQELLEEDENEFDSTIETVRAYNMLDDTIRLIDTIIQTNNQI